MMSEWKEKEQCPPSTEAFSRFIARQPILDVRQVTFGYELLFRTGWNNSYSGDQDYASRTTVDNALAYGFKSLVGESAPFVNCSRDLVVHGIPYLLPKNSVLEILESAEIDTDLVMACADLRKAGYKIALDDYDFTDRWEPMLGIADFVKVDMIHSTPEQRLTLKRKCSAKKVRLIAEKVETDAQFRLAVKEGFHLFQGYFFAKPTVLARPALGPVLQRMRFLKELNQPELDFNRILTLLKGESTLAYKLLRLANSAAIGARGTVTSLDAALTIVGETQFRRMAIVALTTEICGRQPLETHRLILQKARFCELMAGRIGKEPSSMYLFGMMSVVLSVLQLTAESMSGSIQLDPAMMAAYSGSENVYSQLLHCASNHEYGNWPQLAEFATKLGCNEEEISSSVMEATRWADSIIAGAA